MAHPGEYTQRAFLNGKLDLSQAEAVADLIASTNKATHQLAINQLRGGFSSELATLRDQLLHLTSLLELELDFSDHEDLEFADRTELQTLAETIDQRITTLALSFETGQALKQGIPVAIVGKTNVGKSTLLNALLNDERAIVSDIHGTTRDTIEETLDINGVTFRFIDTAGLRETSDTVEQIGIERTRKAIAQARIIIWLLRQQEANPNPNYRRHRFSSYLPENKLQITSKAKYAMDLTLSSKKSSRPPISPIFPTPTSSSPMHVITPPSPQPTPISSVSSTASARPSQRRPHCRRPPPRPSTTLAEITGGQITPKKPSTTSSSTSAWESKSRLASITINHKISRKAFIMSAFSFCVLFK